MKRYWQMAILALPLLATGADAQQAAGPPHAWLYGAWTGGTNLAADTGPACFGQPTVIFTRDVIMRAAVLDVGYRQRAIETVAGRPNGVEIRLVPAAPPGGPLASRLPPDIGFGCAGNPNLLTVERRGDNEIAFPGCTDFPLTLKRCGIP